MLFFYRQVSLNFYLTIYKYAHLLQKLVLDQLRCVLQVTVFLEDPAATKKLDRQQNVFTLSFKISR